MTETLKFAVCCLCQTAVTHGMCSFRCSNDAILPQNRPQGSVEIQIFRYAETVPYDVRSAL